MLQFKLNLSLLHTRTLLTPRRFVRISPAPSLQYKVQDSNGNVIPVQIDTNVDYPSYYTLSFEVMVPPMGYNTYFIAAAAGTPATSPTSTPSGSFSIQNDYVRTPPPIAALHFR